MPLRNRHILLGITGGIAAYKAADLARHLVRGGADVHVVMTEAATRFVTPLTLEALTGNPVGTSLWDTSEGAEEGSREIHHTEAGRHADCIVVAPATANFNGRTAHGLADDLLSSILLASSCPVLLAPAMNAEMWKNPLVAVNLETLRALDRYHVVGPTTGELACRVTGPGRLSEPADIVDALVGVLRDQASARDLEGNRVVVTAGPTREHIDPVRFLSNPSTGRMGIALANAAAQRGAAVTLIHGPVHGDIAPSIECVPVISAADMLEAVAGALEGADVLIMAAAVADWRPSVSTSHKQKKTEGPLALEMVRTPDILEQTAHASGVLRVGFAAETEDLLVHARDKLQRKGLDLLVANEVGPGALSTGFGTATNGGWILSSEGAETEIPVISKAAFADRVLDAIHARLQGAGE
jgi:phosphopantothenoylcysteine decarboxylase/phosphopantothenate--cysteine ligase